MVAFHCLIVIVPILVSIGVLVSIVLTCVCLFGIVSVTLRMSKKAKGEYKTT